jgi:hypothetical protein
MLTSDNHDLQIAGLRCSGKNGAQQIAQPDSSKKKEKGGLGTLRRDVSEA